MNTEPDSLLIIKPSPAWRPIDLGEIWRYRELLYFLVWRDVKVRYKQTTRRRFSNQESAVCCDYETPRARRRVMVATNPHVSERAEGWCSRIMPL